MADDRHLTTITGSARLTAEAVQRHQFPTVRRGFDPAEVRAFMESIARELTAAAEREGELRRLLDDAERRAAHPELDEETLTAVLGQETARVLRAAREAAADVVQRAEEEASRLRTEAQEEADRLQARTRQRVEEQAALSEQAASETRRRALEEAQTRLETARAEAEALVAQARAEGRAMVHEAQEMRAKVLADLAARRRQLHAQIDQLRAGRERLAQTIQGVRTVVEEVANELLHAEDDARTAAEAAVMAPPVEHGAGSHGPDGPIAAGSATATPTVGDGGDVIAASSERGPDRSPSGAGSPDEGLVGVAGAAGAAAPAGLPGAGVRRGQVSRSGPAVRRDPSPRPPSSTGPDQAATRREPTAPDQPTPPGSPVAEAREQQRPVDGGRAVSARPGSSAATPFRSVVAAPVEIVGAVPAGRAAVTPDDASAPKPGATPGGGDPVGAGEAGSVLGGATSGGGDPVGARHVRGGARTEPGRRASRDVDAVFARLRAGGLAPRDVVVEGDADGAEGAGEDDGPAVRLLQHGVTPRPRRRHAPRPPLGEAPDGAAGSPAASGVGSSTGTAVGSAAAPPSRLRATADDRAAAAIEHETNAAAPAGAGTMAAAVDPSLEDPGRGADAVAEAHAEAEADAVAEADADGTRAAEDPGPSGGRAGDAEVLQRRDDLLRPVLASLTRRLKRTLQDDQNDLLDRLRNLGSRSDAADAVLPDEAAHRTRYADAARTGLAEAVDAGASFAVAVTSSGSTAAVARAAPTAAVQRVAAETAEELARTMVSALRRRLVGAEGTSSGEESEGSLVAERVGAAFREWKGSRVEALVADHAVAAFNQGVLQVSPADATVRWVVDDDGGPCADCDDNALADQQRVGETFPTGHRHPPAHGGCRCLLVPASP